jgi:PAS domain S-box-containing protein
VAAEPSESERLTAIVRTSSDAIVDLTPAGIVAGWNPAAERLFGWTAREILGRAVEVIVPPARRAQAAELLQRAAGGAGVDVIPTVWVTRDGRPVDVGLTLVPIRDPSGAVTAVTAVVRESVDRAQNEYISGRLAAIVDSADDVIVGKTLDGIITSWNRAAERLFGWTEAEAIGRHITLIIPPERHPEEDGVLARIRRGERVEHFETVRVTKDGRLVDVALTVSPIRDASGRIVGASKIARDITEQRQVAITQARLAAIVDSSDDVIISKTLDGIITSWNGAAERLFGWSVVEAIGQHITLIIPEDRWAEENGVLARIRRGERVDHFDTVRITKDRRLVDVSVTVSPVRDARGRIVGASKIARDISERRRVEAERVRMLEREQEARLRAEELNRTKDQLLATVSHELRTPLNSVFGWARMMQSTPMDEAARARALDAIVRSAAAQARLVEDLLDLSRIVTGRLRLELAPLELNPVIEAALETVRPAARSKGVELTAALDRDVGTILGAPDRLQQIVWNLVTNAVKFTPRGGHVRVASRRTEDAVSIEVADDGEGIAADALPHVFEPFRQEDSSSTRAHGGLGLGLTLVRQLAEAHGGTVRAESAGKGRGSRFTVTLPVSVSSVATGREGGEDERERPRRLRGVRVLMVDDDPDALEMWAVMMRSAGAEVRTASTAFAAYEIAGGWRPHVVVTDLSMPGEDGFALLDELRRALTGGGKIPVIAVTAYGTPETRERALSAGFDGFLTKPVDPVALTSAVALSVRAE